MTESTGQRNFDGDPLAAVLAYHERTKHHFHRFARSLGHLDWANQPDPFRRYEGAPFVRLAIREGEPLPRYDDLFVPRAAPVPVDSRSVSSFLYHSLALSAWKSFQGASWALRVNPSSGNLHPTEGYLILPPIAEIGERAGVYHYAPREHGLERRAEVEGAAWMALAGGLPPGAFFAALASVHWREAWKYGERAYRYCQHDAGHAIAACRIAAAALGWRLRIVPAIAHADLAALLGVDREGDFGEAEREEADLLAIVSPVDLPPPDWRPSRAAIRAVAASVWTGRANRLSHERIVWEAIETVADAGRLRDTEKKQDREEGRSGGESLSDAAPTDRRAERPLRGRSASEIIRTRRSAVSMDGRTSMEADDFFFLLGRLLPCRSVPWDLLPWRARVHLGLFVHRVRGLDPGLYWLLRDPGEEGNVRAALNPEFSWERPPGAPRDLPLFALAKGDVQGVAATVSCGQEIAGEGVFSAGMLARFEPILRERGAHAYPWLFRETGVIGQMLYLEAEAAGLRGTGIGCFFDDPVHEVFGIRSADYQSLYHFTVGGPVDDPRLSTLPAYPASRLRPTE